MVQPTSTFARGVFGSYMKKDMMIATKGTSSAIIAKHSKNFRIITSTL